MHKWMEIHSAYQVAKAGTVSGAADTLGIHRATVMRHIDSLEVAFGTKLFHRHAKGYTPTEIGRALFSIADQSNQKFDELLGLTKGQLAKLTGELIITSTGMFVPTLAAVAEHFQREHPEVRIEFLTTQDLPRLEYGEAHIAIRTGDFERDEDNVVLPFATVRSALYAHQSYVDRFGVPSSQKELEQHRFISRDFADPKFAPFVWLKKHVPEEQIVVTSSDTNSKYAAIQAGLGIGFMPIYEANARPGLVQVHPHNSDWNVDFWLVTHVDLHRTNKVQAFLDSLRSFGFLNPRGEFPDLIAL